MFKPSKRFFTILLIILAVILVFYGLLRLKFGVFLPKAIDDNLYDGIIIAAVCIMVWNRKIVGDEKKEAEAKKAAEEKTAAEAAEGREVEDRVEERGAQTASSEGADDHRSE
jgi:hypothetical protein